MISEIFFLASPTDEHAVLMFWLVAVSSKFILLLDNASIAANDPIRIVLDVGEFLIS